MANYQLELLGTPCQTSYSYLIMGSKEKQAQIITEVAKLLGKSAIQETQLLPKSFVSQTFLVEKKDGGQRPVVNLKCLNQFMRVEHFKDGEAPTPSRPYSSRRLDDQTGPERCIHISRSLFTQIIKKSWCLDGTTDSTNLNVSHSGCLQPLSFHQTAKTSNWLSETKRMSPDNLLRTTSYFYIRTRTS